MVLYPISLAYEGWFLGALQTFREPPTGLHINCIRHSEKNNAGLKNISFFCQFFFLQVYFNMNCTPSIVNIKVPIDDLLFICLKLRYSRKLRKQKWGTLPPTCEHLVHSFIFVFSLILVYWHTSLTTPLLKCYVNFSLTFSAQRVSSTLGWYCFYRVSVCHGLQLVWCPDHSNEFCNWCHLISEALSMVQYAMTLAFVNILPFCFHSRTILYQRVQWKLGWISYHSNLSFSWH